jgi:hypothetical protein
MRRIGEHSSQRVIVDMASASAFSGKEPECDWTLSAVVVPTHSIWPRPDATSDPSAEQRRGSLDGWNGEGESGVSGERLWMVGWLGAE